jgi:magnesium-transporting ATPase (P-type)
MKAFAQVKPEDAEVLRNGKWIRYEASSLVKGDIIKLEEGDIVPADCVVLTVDSENDLVVDCRCVAGEDKPRSASAAAATTTGSTTVKPIQLFLGGHTAQGSATAVVTATGSNTLLASLIRENRFPPKDNGGMVAAADNVQYATVGADEEVGISLMGREQHPSDGAPATGEFR